MPPLLKMMVPDSTNNEFVYEVPLKKSPQKASKTIEPCGPRLEGKRRMMTNTARRNSSELFKNVSAVSRNSGTACGVDRGYEGIPEGSFHILDITRGAPPSAPSSRERMSTFEDSLIIRRKSAAVALIEQTLSEIDMIGQDYDGFESDASSDHGLTSVSAQSVPPLKKKKVVRFRLYKNEYIPPAKEALTTDEISQSWWSSKDYSKSVRRTKAFIAAFPKDNKEPMQDLIRLVALCYNAGEGGLNDHHRALALTPNVSRGLESEIIPPLKLSRERHMAAVLDVIRNVPPSDVDAIALRSIALSRPHQILAEVFARRDAVAAGEFLQNVW